MIQKTNDSAYTLYLDPEPKSKGRFQKGKAPWNKGLSWKEQGLSEDEVKKRILRLRANAQRPQKGCKPAHPHPVIQMDEYGNRLHWYVSSEAAARKLGIFGRNIRKVCDGERKHCGGFCWRWDEMFK